MTYECKILHKYEPEVLTLLVQCLQYNSPFMSRYLLLYNFNKKDQYD